MLTFTADRQNYWPYILKRWAFSVIAFILVFLYDYFYPSDFAKGLYWALGFGSIVQFIALVSRPRINKVVIDEARETLSQYYSSPISGKGEKIILLDHIRIYIKRSKAAGNAPYAIDFYKDYRRVMYLDKNGDGFSSASLQEIGQLLEKLGARVTLQ
jgi:hypothetical protein